MSLPWYAYRFLGQVAGSLAPLVRGVLPQPEQPLWPERLGCVRAPAGVHAWIHAASLGETLGVPPLMRALSARRPGAMYWCTSTTRSGRDRLAQSGARCSLAPLDTPQSVRRFVCGVQPRLVLVLETELWPNWLAAFESQALPAALVSARITERSLRRYRWFGAPLRRALAGLDAVLAQSHADAERFVQLGARRERVMVTGNLKDDGLPEAALDRPAARAALGAERQRPLLVLGSLRPGEARRIARAWQALPPAVRSHWQVVAVPRHAAASASLTAEVAGQGVGIGEGVGQWRWDDRAGVLRAWYTAADAAFVGGSLEPFGGHNPLEPASCGAAVLMGPHHAHQQEGVGRLVEAGALVLLDPEDPGRGLLDVLGDAKRRAALGAAARQATEALRGAADRSVAALERFGLWGKA